MVDELHRQRVLNFLEMFYAGDIEGALSRCTDDVDFFANAPIDILPQYGPPPRQGRTEDDVANHPRPLFQHAV